MPCIFLSPDAEQSLLTLQILLDCCVCTGKNCSGIITTHFCYNYLIYYFAMFFL